MRLSYYNGFWDSWSGIETPVEQFKSNPQHSVTYREGYMHMLRKGHELLGVLLGDVVDSLPNQSKAFRETIQAQMEMGPESIGFYIPQIVQPDKNGITPLSFRWNYMAQFSE